MPEIPPYTVRVSDRARHARLSVSARDGLVVVVPRHYPQRRIPQIVAGRREWIERAMERVREHREALAAGADVLPDVIELAGLGERWQVEYRRTDAEGVRITRHAGSVRVTGGVEDADACRAALTRFCRARAAERLPELLRAVSAEQRLPFSLVKVRAQRTRWGSCSARGNINLNWTLAFLPPDLVRHVLVHELVHTLRLDHSPQFRALLAERDPEAPRHAAELKAAWRHVPPWAVRG